MSFYFRRRIVDVVLMWALAVLPAGSSLCVALCPAAGSTALAATHETHEAAVPACHPATAGGPAPVIAGQHPCGAHDATSNDGRLSLTAARADSYLFPQVHQIAASFRLPASEASRALPAIDGPLADAVPLQTFTVLRI